MAFAENHWCTRERQWRQWKPEVIDHQLKVTYENHKGGQIKFQGLCNIFNQDGTISSEDAEGSRDEGFQASKCINLNVSIPSFKAHFFLGLN